MNDIIDVSLLKGEAALDSVNEGIIECTCDEYHTCQECYETIRKLEKNNLIEKSSATIKHKVIKELINKMAFLLLKLSHFVIESENNDNAIKLLERISNIQMKILNIIHKKNTWYYWW